MFSNKLHPLDYLLQVCCYGIPQLDGFPPHLFFHISYHFANLLSVDEIMCHTVSLKVLNMCVCFCGNDLLSVTNCCICHRVSF